MNFAEGHPEHTNPVTSARIAQRLKNLCVYKLETSFLSLSELLDSVLHSFCVLTYEPTRVFGLGHYVCFLCFKVEEERNITRKNQVHHCAGVYLHIKNCKF